MKKIIVIIGILLVILLQILSLIGFIYSDYNKKIDNVTKTINIPVAAVDIPKGTIINSNMVATVEQNNVDNKYYLTLNEIIGKTATKDIKKNDLFSISNLMSDEIVFNYKESTTINNDITKPFLNYNSIYYYYTNNNQLLEISYHNAKYSIDDIIRLNVLSLNTILNESSNNENESNGKIYKYKTFNIQACNNNNIYITGNTDSKNYCEK